MNFVGFKTLINLDNVKQITLNQIVTVGSLNEEDVFGQCHVINFVDGETKLVFFGTESFETERGTLDEDVKHCFSNVEVANYKGEERTCIIDYDLFMILPSLSKEHI